jgi:hypothetical protein
MQETHLTCNKFLVPRSDRGEVIAHHSGILADHLVKIALGESAIPTGIGARTPAAPLDKGVL